MPHSDFHIAFRQEHMYYSFPIFARLAALGKTTAAPSVEAVPAKTHEVVADPATHTAPEEQSGIKAEEAGNR